MRELLLLTAANLQASLPWLMLLLPGLCLSLLGDRHVWRRWPQCLLMFALGFAALMCDDLVQLFLYVSAASWLGLLTFSQPIKFETPDSGSTHDVRWCSYFLLADVAAIGGLAWLRSTLPTTTLSVLKSSALLVEISAREPAFLNSAAALLLAAVAIRLGLYPVLGWLKATTTGVSTTIWTICWLFPLVAISWVRLLPIFFYCTETRVLGIGLGTLSAVILSGLACWTSDRNRVLIYVAAGWNSLFLVATLAAPELALQIFPSLLCGLLGLGLIALLMHRFYGWLAIAGWALAIVLIARTLTAQGVTIASLQSLDNLPQVQASLPMLLAMQILAALLLTWALSAWIRTASRRSEEQGGGEIPARFAACVRLADSELHLDALIDKVFAWPLWCLLLVLGYLSDFACLTVPSVLNRQFSQVTKQTLDDLDQPESTSLHWELILGTLCVLALAVWAASTP